MPQPPNVSTIAHVLSRAKIIHGPEAAELLAESLAADWRAAEHEGSQQALYAAAWQLHRASQFRAKGADGIANMLDHLAEACISGWVDEVDVSQTPIEDSPAAG